MEQSTQLRIYSPAKNAMQSGRANQDKWVVEMLRQVASLPSRDIGWSGSSDTNAQIKMQFDSLESAKEYAIKNGFSYEIIEHNTRKIKPKAYADNFAFNRVQPWTH